MPLHPSGPPPSPPDRGGDQNDPSVGAGPPHPQDEGPSHDIRRRRLRLRLSIATQEAIRSFAEAHGVSEAGLLDALFHGLETADQGWLEQVTERARRMDAYYRSEDARTSTDDTPPS
ncbi:MAG TPA: hypothetical protein VFV02_06925 [Acidimicrobiales bacterium]|nr:hypothetical protein [Acidimicrobiales bacterium]